VQAAAQGDDPRAQEGPPPSQSPAVILIADDFDDNREMYAEYLTFVGYQTTQATTGAAAIQQAQTFHPDVIVMGLSLPEIDGWEVIRRLKAADKTRGIPVVVVTGHALKGAEKAARDAGADVFLTKPCLPDELAASIARILQANGEARRSDTVI
jgi:CheY-like chemotaxis protein